MDETFSGFTETETNKQSVLLVDDNPANLQLLVDCLSDRGFEILIAKNGKTALKRALYVQPALILLDVMMPEMDGFEVCRRLKEDDRTEDIPVVFMTALAEVENKVTGFKAGAVDYLTKPLNSEEVVARVTAHLKIQRLTKALRGAAKLLEVKNRELEGSNASLALINEELAEANERLKHSYDDLKRERALREIEARRMEVELATAQSVQRMLIPDRAPEEIPGFEFAFSYEPAVETGGDWLGFFPNASRTSLSICIGDVNDHGAAPALVTAGVYSAFSLLRQQPGGIGTLDIDRLLHMLNGVVADMAGRKLHMTFLASRLDCEKKLLRVASAGHPMPILIRGRELGGSEDTGRWQGIRQSSLMGTPLGCTATAEYDIRSIELKSGDVVVWYTDGVLLGEDNPTGMRRFMFWIRELHQLSAEEIKDALEARMTSELDGRRPDDDMAFIVAKVF